MCVLLNGVGAQRVEVSMRARGDASCCHGDRALWTVGTQTLFLVGEGLPHSPLDRPVRPPYTCHQGGGEEPSGVNTRYEWISHHTSLLNMDNPLFRVSTQGQNKHPHAQR